MDKLIEDCIKNNCIKTGLFTLKNGNRTRFYFNMKNLISYPQLLIQCADELYKKLPPFDIICAIPTGSMCIATCISVRYNKPMIFIRDNKKLYGTSKQIEGEYKKSSRCVLIDDVITTGNSIQTAYSVLKNKIDTIYFSSIVDRQMSSHTFSPHISLFSKTNILIHLMKKYMTEKKSNICFSADITDPNKLLDILSVVGPRIIACKLHFDIIDVSKYKGDFIQSLMILANKHNFLIIEDRKFVDISYIVEKQYTKIKEWADLVTVHGSINKNVINKLSGVILVANMSNNIFNYNSKCLQLAEKYSDRIFGFVTQQRLECKNKLCLTPGVSLSNNKKDDQNYRKANTINTDILIVGRSIYNSSNPLHTIELLLK